MKFNCRKITIGTVWLTVLGMACFIPKAGAKITDTVSSVPGDAFQGQQNAQVLKIKISFPGLPIDLVVRASKFYFSTNGITNTADITKARLYYTGTNDLTGALMPESDSIGQAVASPNGRFVFSTTKQLKIADNYFFLTYDVSSSVASLKDLLNATLDSVLLSDTLIRFAKGSAVKGKAIDFYENYCPVSVLVPNSVKANYIGITHVKIGSSISNATADLDKLTFYPSQQINVYRQESYPVQIKYGDGSNEQIIGWVDWNNDGVIDTTTETVFYTRSSLSAETWSTTITVPCTATPGYHKLRIESDIDSLPKLKPCSNLRYGDAEEYLIYVQADVYPAKVSFVADTPRYLGSPVNFINNSGMHGNYITDWCFSNSCFANSNAVYDAKGNTVSETWTQSTNGKAVYNVKMRAIWEGCDSTVVKYYSDSITLESPPNAPVTAFIASQGTADTTTIIQLTDMSTGKPGSWYWQIAPAVLNGAPAFSYLNGTNYSSQNPVIKFNHKGLYNVSLTAHNGYGLQTITKKGYLNVLDYSRLCDGIDTIRGASGFLYDDGGKNSPYGNNKSCYVVIKPPCATAIKISFNAFDVSTLGKGQDYLQIFDSTNASGTSLTAAAGYPNGFQNDSPGNAAIIPPSIVAKSGTAYIKFTTDSSFRGAGFEAFWSSVLRTESPPKAAFTGPDTIYFGHTARFVSQSTGPELRYFWDLSGDGKNDHYTPNPSFAYDSAGRFNVRLITQNCGGVDTVIKPIFIKTNTARPVAYFTTNVTENSLKYTTVGSNDPVQFLDKSTQNPYKWVWHISPVNRQHGYSFVNSDSTSQNPVVQFPDSGFYSVSLVVINDKGKAMVVKDSMINVVKYCTPLVATPTGAIGISKVLITDRNGDTIINHSSTCGDTGYNAYMTNNPPSLVQDNLYHVTISRDTAAGNMNGTVWMDYSNDGEFNLADDTLFTVKNISGKTWTGSFQVRKLRTGTSRIRVGVTYYTKTIDACGVNAVGEFEDYNVVLQKDTVPPVITLKGKDTAIVEIDNPYFDAGATAYDLADGDITVNMVTVDSVNPQKTGFYYVTYNVTDNNGNNAKEVVRVVKVIGDTTRPIITLKGSNPYFVEVFNGYSEDSASVKDNIDTGLTIQISGTIDTMHTGVYYIKYTSTDQSNNMATVYRKVIVGDTVPPMVQVRGKNPDKVLVLTAYRDSGVTATDNYTQQLIYTVQHQVNTSRLGKDSVVYTVSDSAGNTVTVVRQIQVIDTIRPTIKFPFDTLLWDVYVPFVAPLKSAIVKDYFFNPSQDVIHNGADTLSIHPIGVVDYTKLGYYPAMYYVSNPKLYSKSDTFIVHVVDRVPPTVTLFGDTIVYLQRWQNYTDLQFTYGDNYDRNPIFKITGTYQNSDYPGVYYRNYQAIDHSGNKSAIAVRWFVVGDAYGGINVADSQSASFQFFPNPAKEQIYISYLSPRPDYVEMYITDMLGKKVKALYAGNPLSLHLEPSVSDLPAGVYLISLQSAARQSVYKLVIER